jgi:hypothetical protein
MTRARRRQASRPADGRSRPAVLLARSLREAKHVADGRRRCIHKEPQHKQITSSVALNCLCHAPSIVRCLASQSLQQQQQQPCCVAVEFERLAVPRTINRRLNESHLRNCKQSKRKKLLQTNTVMKHPVNKTTQVTKYWFARVGASSLSFLIAKRNGSR